VGADAQPAEEAEHGEIGVVDAAHLEHVVGVHDDTVLFRLATPVVDDRRPRAGGCVAPLARSLPVLRGPALLLEVRVVGHGGLLSRVRVTM
jgi:hypothetical protein